MKLADTITGVQHLGIPAADIDESVAFYCDRLGFTLIHRKLSVDTLGNAIEAAFVQLGNLVLELFRPAGSEDEIRNRTDGILDHYAIDAPDFENCMNRAMQKGLKLHLSTQDGAVWYRTVGRKGVKGVNFCGPDNEVIELCYNFESDYGDKTGLQGWSHLAIKVRNLAASIAFYEGLGFDKCADGYLDTPDGRLIIGFVKLGDFQMELIQVAPAMLAELGQRGAGHIDHVALDVKNIQEAFFACRHENYRLLTPTVKELSFFEHGIKYFLIEGPDGEIIELNQKITY